MKIKWIKIYNIIVHTFIPFYVKYLSHVPKRFDVLPPFSYKFDVQFVYSPGGLFGSMAECYGSVHLSAF